MNMLADRPGQMLLEQAKLERLRDTVECKAWKEQGRRTDRYVCGMRIMFLPPSAVGRVNVIRVATQLLRSVFQAGYVLVQSRRWTPARRMRS